MFSLLQSVTWGNLGTIDSMLFDQKFNLNNFKVQRHKISKKKFSNRREIDSRENQTTPKDFQKFKTPISSARWFVKVLLPVEANLSVCFNPWVNGSRQIVLKDIFRGKIGISVIKELSTFNPMNFGDHNITPSPTIRFLIRSEYRISYISD